ncbi:MAG: hypothetical protein IJB00_00035 [Akkermansia sp.]|nr:hypothetical protein [Akkermansia sp.]
MTKNIFSVLCLPGLLLSPVAIAQDIDADATEEVSTDKKNDKKNILTKVRKLKPKFAKLPKSAEYLMVCKFSAEDEGAEEMLKALSGELGKLKSEKIALLVVCEDESAKAAAKMMKNAKLKAPAVFTSNLPKKIKDASEYLPETSDTISLVDMDGKEVISGDASLAEGWKDELQYLQDMKDWENVKVDEKKYPVAAALKKMTTPTFGMFDTKADYYIYLFSASWCGPCKAIMPDIAQKHYPEMQKTRNPKVEIILLGMDQTPEGVGQYRDHYKAKFFAVHQKDPMVRQLPGFNSPGGIPHCIFVDKEGNTIKSGHGSIIANWKSIVGNAK